MYCVLSHRLPSTLSTSISSIFCPQIHIPTMIPSVMPLEYGRLKITRKHGWGKEIWDEKDDLYYTKRYKLTTIPSWGKPKTRFGTHRDSSKIRWDNVPKK